MATAERASLELPADDVELYRRLAHQMNAHPERYRALGDADMVAVLTVHGPGGATNVQLVFEALGCDLVCQVPEEETRFADFRLVGDLDSWSTMFNHIVSNGHASGEWTINSLALRGDRIRCEGDDPMGLDKFSRFNQTLQEFLDGASAVVLDDDHPKEAGS